MSELAGLTCAVSNARISMQNSKKVSLSKIPIIYLLKVSDDLKNLIQSIQPSNTERSNQTILTIEENNTISMTDHSQSNRLLCV